MIFKNWKLCIFKLVIILIIFAALFLIPKAAIQNRKANIYSAGICSFDNGKWINVELISSKTPINICGNVVSNYRLELEADVYINNDLNNSRRLLRSVNNINNGDFIIHFEQSLPPGIYKVILHDGRVSFRELVFTVIEN